MGLPRWLSGKELPTNAGDTRDRGLIPGSGRSPGGGHGNPLQYSCPENPHVQRSLMGYSPWGCKESDMTERLSIAQLARSSQRVSWYGAGRGHVGRVPRGSASDC